MKFCVDCIRETCESTTKHIQFIIKGNLNRVYFKLYEMGLREMLIKWVLVDCYIPKFPQR